MIEITGEWPAEVPPHWMTYFAVDDCDATTGRAAELGATVLVAPADIPPGRFAVLRDPLGAVFSLIAVGADAARPRRLILWRAGPDRPPARLRGQLAQHVGQDAAVA